MVADTNLADGPFLPLLTERYPAAQIARILLGPDEYQPFPTASDREAWAALPAPIRAREISAGEAMLTFAWPPLTATMFMDFMRTGDRQRFEERYFARRNALGQLAMAECIEGRGRFLDEIVNGIWALCDEASWVLPAHCYRWPIERIPMLPDPSYDYLDLFAAETGALLAWTYYLLRSQLDAIEPMICVRIRRELRRRILDPFLSHTDYWWMGLSRHDRLNNWAPWCTSNCLAVALLLEEDPARRVEAVAKSLWIVDRFLGGYHSDGGCDEGPTYWTQAGASLFDCLELLYGATRGAIDIYDVPLVGEIGRYIQRMHIGGDYFVNFADAGAVMRIPGDLIYRYGRRIGDRALTAFGARAADSAPNGDWYALFRKLPSLFDAGEIERTDTAVGVIRDTWLDGIQVMTAREHVSERGFYLAAKGGHNDESHNHNDVGQFIVYLDGRPILNDAGVGTYTRQTFSSQRYELWTMQSAYHNLPTVNGVQQAPGVEYAAREVRYTCGDAGAELSMDIAGAYPASAGISSWRRACRLLRSPEASVEIHDDFNLAAPTADLTLSLLTPCSPRVGAPGIITLSDTEVGEVQLQFDPSLVPTIERIDIDDDRLKLAWGDHLHRILVTTATPVQTGKWVLRVTR